MFAEIWGLFPSSLPCWPLSPRMLSPSQLPLRSVCTQGTGKPGGPAGPPLAPHLVEGRVLPLLHAQQGWQGLAGPPTDSLPPLSLNLLPQPSTFLLLREEGWGQDWLHNLQDPVQNGNARLLVPKLLRISSQPQQSTKANTGPF